VCGLSARLESTGETYEVLVERRHKGNLKGSS
jgi:ribosome maturation protein Sdo1